MTLKRLAALPLLLLAVSAPALMDCSAKDLAGAAGGCDISGGASAIANLDVDAKIKVALQATADLQALGTAMLSDTGKACVAINTDLGVTDTWTAKGAATTTDYVNEACAQASAKIDAVMKAGVTAGCTFTLDAKGGQCQASLDAQASCDAKCQVDAACTPGMVEAQCMGGLYGKCEPVKCAGDVTCAGSVDVAAMCQGTCDATCSGGCTGSCSGTITGGCTGMCEGKCDGMATPAGGMANCAGTCEGKCSAPAASAKCEGSCSATCTGTCKGNCKLAANASVMCSGAVSCSGGCTGGYTEPTCTGTIKPPSCMVDANCEGSCQGSVTATAKCSPPSVQIVAACSASTSDIDKLLATLKTNLPTLFLNAKVRGQAAVDLIGSSSQAIAASFSAAVSGGGKAVACVAAAGKAELDAAVNVKASVSVSVDVSAKASAGGKS